MKGTRPLDNDEIRSVPACFTDLLYDKSIVKGGEIRRAVI